MQHRWTDATSDPPSPGEAAGRSSPVPDQAVAGRGSSGGWGARGVRGGEVSAGVHSPSGNKLPYGRASAWLIAVGDVSPLVATFSPAYRHGDLCARLSVVGGGGRGEWLTVVELLLKPVTQFSDASADELLLVGYAGVRCGPGDGVDHAVFQVVRYR